jgi:protein TonB
MEAKKNPKVELSRKYSLFLNIGMVVSLGLCLVAFEWKSYEDLSRLDLSTRDILIEPNVEIPVTEHKLPEPPKIKEPIIKEVPDDIEVEKQLIDIETEITDQIVAPPTPPVEVAAQPVEEEETNEPFIIVENPPMPQGGYEGFTKYLQKNLKYPEQARRMNVEGRVFVQFIIDKDGSPTDITVLKGIGSGCDEEAARVIKNMPKWNPGKQRGKPVRVKMSLPITFKLG